MREVGLDGSRSRERSRRPQLSSINHWRICSPVGEMEIHCELVGISATDGFVPPPANGLMAIKGFSRF